MLAALSHGAQAWSVLAAAQRIGVLLGLPVRALHVRTAGLAVPEYLADSGVACLDAFTQLSVIGNHASTGDDDIFGTFTTCP